MPYSAAIAHEDFVYRAETAVDLDRATPAGKCAVDASLECATMIEDDVDRFESSTASAFWSWGSRTANQMGSGRVFARSATVT
jgi:hypothetical protein